jgi:hypothetical protein
MVTKDPCLLAIEYSRYRGPSPFGSLSFASGATS